MDAEAWVADALLADGWSVLARNWMGEGGELDLVVLRDGKLRVVEVKAREAEDPLGDEAITATKLARLRRAAAAYVHLHPDGWDEVAFLVAWVDTTVRPWSIRWLDDAFDGPP